MGQLSNLNLHKFMSPPNKTQKIVDEHLSNPKGPSTQFSYTLKNSNLHNYYPKPEYPIIGSFGPLG